MKKIIFLLLLLNNVFATDHDVLLLNKSKTDKSEKMVFEPMFLKIEVGDTIHFKMPDPGHNVKSMVVPAGAEELKGRMNKPLSYTFKKEGLYLIKCQPHYGMGMIGLYQVGNPVNLAEIKTVKVTGRRTKERFEKMLSAIQ